MEKKLTDSGIEIKPVYTVEDSPAMKELPGQFPYTRGVQADMYRGKLWTMRQYAGFSTAEESNKRYLYLLSQGVMGLSVAFDLPTQIGYDSDHALSDGEVGKVGVAIDTLDDMRILFKDIKLEDVSTSMTINATGFILLAFYVALAKEQGADLSKINGTIQNDILKEYAEHISIRPNLLCGSSPIFLNGAAGNSPNGIRFPFRAIIFGKQAAQPRRRSHSH
jgi:methylmalonyl-CoA mutase N-terminal domain/subunit